VAPLAEVEEMLVALEVVAANVSEAAPEGHEPGVAPLAATDEQQLRRSGPQSRNLAPQVRLDLVGEPAAGQSIGIPNAAILDEEPVVDPACGPADRFAGLCGDVGAEGPRARSHPLLRRRPRRRPAPS